MPDAIPTVNTTPPAKNTPQPITSIDYSKLIERGGSSVLGGPTISNISYNGNAYTVVKNADETWDQAYLRVINSGTSESLNKDPVTGLVSPQNTPMKIAPPYPTEGQTPAVSGAGTSVQPEQAQPAIASPSSPDNSAIANLPNLSPGMNGDQVKQLQQWLIGQGFQIPSGATGFYGNETKAAVTAWQQKNGINAQGNPGYFGPISKAFLSQGNQSGNQVLGNSATVPQAQSVTTPNGDTSMTPTEASIPSQNFFMTPEEANGGQAGLDAYNARIASLRGDTSTPQGAAYTAMTNNGAKTTPADFAKDPIQASIDTYNQIYSSLGLSPINTQISTVMAAMEKIDTDLQEKINNINEDPWISETLRLKKIKSQSDSSTALKTAKAKELSLYQSLYDKGVQQAQFITGQAVAVFKQQQQFDEQRAMQAIRTADTMAVNASKTTTSNLTSLEKDYLFAVKNDGYKGSLLQFTKDYHNATSKSTSSGGGTTMTNFNKDFDKGPKITEDLNQFIRRLQGLHPEINPDDIARKAQDTYGTGPLSSGSADTSSPDSTTTNDSTPWWQFWNW